MISKWLSFIILSQAVQAIVIPKDPNEGPPVATFYRPPVYPAVPIRIGERRALKSCKIKLIQYLFLQDVIITITGASSPASSGPGCRPSATECRRRTMGSISRPERKWGENAKQRFASDNRNPTIHMYNMSMSI